MTVNEHLKRLPQVEQRIVVAYLQAPPGKDPVQHAVDESGVAARDVAAVLTTPRVVQLLAQAGAEVRAHVSQPPVLAQSHEVMEGDPVIDSAWVLAELVRLQRASVRDFMIVDGQGQVQFNLDAENAPALDDLQSFEMSEHTDGMGEVTRSLKFKLPDKLKATELIGKHHAVRAFETRTEADESDEQLVARIRAGRDRLARLKHGDGDK